MLRSLRWFDQVDVRDPLQMTNGVWAALGRYYFLNNANLWLWCLYGNKETKGLELIKTKHNVPEIGGRIQYPVPSGEAALTYHYRQADSRNLEGMLPGYALIPENRIGVDVKWDKFIGFWIEGVWVNKQKNVEMFTNSEMFTAGMDYTFAIGNGLTMMLEHMFLSYSEEAFSFDNNYNFTGLSLVYPIGMFDRINVMPYYDWLNESAYLFFYWQKEFNNLSLYLMGYINPEKNNIPMMAGSENLFGGTGVQFMFVYNH